MKSYIKGHVSKMKSPGDQLIAGLRLLNLRPSIHLPCSTHNGAACTSTKQSDKARVGESYPHVLGQL